MKWKYLLITALVFFMVVVTMRSAISQSLPDGSYFHPDLTNVTYIFNGTITFDWLLLNDTCLVLNGGTANGIYCNSSATNLTIYIESRISIDLVFPTDGFDTSTSLTPFRYTANTLDPGNCTLYWGGIAINTSTKNGTNIYEYFTNLPVGGSGGWYVDCYDASGAYAISDTWILTRSSSGNTGGAPSGGYVTEKVEYNLTPKSFTYRLRPNEVATGRFTIQNLESSIPLTIQIQSDLDLEQTTATIQPGTSKDFYFDVYSEVLFEQITKDIKISIIKNVYTRANELVSVSYFINEFENNGEECINDDDCYSGVCNEDYRCEAETIDLDNEKIDMNETDLIAIDLLNKVKKITDRVWIYVVIINLILILILSYIIYRLDKRDKKA